MAAPAADGGLAGVAREVAERASSLVRLEIELAQLEVKRKAAALGVGAGLAITALVLLLFMLGFALAGAAAGLATVLPVWAALLVVAGVLLLLAGTLASVGLKSIKRGAPPVPRQAIDEARKTTAALKGAGSA